VPLTRYYLGEQVKRNEMGGARRTYGGEDVCKQGFGGENLGKEIIWKTEEGEYNIKINLQEVGWGAWTGLSWLRTGIGGELL